MGTDAASRARAWVHENQAAVCDVIESWEHGTVIRATRYPDYWDYNLVRIEDDAELTAAELVCVADEGLSGLAHRRAGFEVASAGEPIRPDLEALGWMTTRLVWMRHEGGVEPTTRPDIEQVAYDAVRHLRVDWHHEDFPGIDPTDFMRQGREISMARGAEVYAAFERGAPVGFAQLERAGATAEVTNVFVHPDHRGRGLGTALTQATIEAGRDATDLWIVADDEGRPKEIYGRLGFRPEWKLLDCLRLPGGT
jgi:GNAT superfamily N-acetyltransferase